MTDASEWTGKWEVSAPSDHHEDRHPDVLYIGKNVVIWWGTARPELLRRKPVK